MVQERLDMFLVVFSFETITYPIILRRSNLYSNTYMLRQKVYTYRSY